MGLKKISFKTKEELIAHIKTHEPTFYYSSQTSTVIPYDKLEEIYSETDFTLGDLSRLPSHMELTANNTLLVKGPVNWKDAKQFLRSKHRNLMTAPTEDLALISAGAATSATGERCFHFGNLRSQIKKIKYINFEGEEIELSSNCAFPIELENIAEYQKEFEVYKDFKNAPYPRFETATDLMIGTEGQLGVITEIEIETTADSPVHHLFMLLPRWEENVAPHLEILEKIQAFRQQVILCELIDANSFEYLPADERPNQGMDAIFFEVMGDEFENFYEHFLMQLSFLDENLVFELSESKFHQTRASVPRAVFEENSRMGVIKMGTDVQVKIADFATLMQIYQDFSKIGVRYNLFGHFGDAHLHFNFMPQTSEIPACKKALESMYDKVSQLEASPFAEHGIGIIKQKYIKSFWTETTFKTFKELKQKCDPHNQFFPQGYMNLKQN